MNEGLLFFGYAEDEAKKIHLSISKGLNKLLFKKSASGKENETIEQLLEGSSDQFDEENPKILMFVSLDDTEIQASINSFPRSVHRPIFCCLTPHNLNWSFHKLKDHLLDEQAYWQKQKAQQKQ